MPALSQLAWGLILVVLDLRLGGPDVIPDPIGWVIACVALTSLAREHSAFNWAAAVCLPAAAVSIPEWFGSTGDLITLVTSIAEVVIVFATCTGVMAVVPSERRTADLIRWWALGLAAAYVLGLASDGELDDARVLMVLVGSAAFVVLVVFLRMLFRVARQPAPATAAD